MDFEDLEDEQGARGALEFGGDADGSEPRRIASLRARIDGFTPERQRRFLGALVETGCVKDSARIAGVSTTTIDRVRRNFPDFDSKCRAALDLAVPNLEAIAYRRATVGAPEKVIRKGRLVEVRIKPSDAMLRTLLAGAAPAKYGRLAGLRPAAGGAGGPGAGGRAWEKEPSPDEVAAKIVRKVEAIKRHRTRSGEWVAAPGGGLLPKGYRAVPVGELERLGWRPPEGEEAGAG